MKEHHKKYVEVIKECLDESEMLLDPIKAYAEKVKEICIKRGLSPDYVFSASLDIVVDHDIDYYLD